jgi:hypothetical protein
MDSISEGKYSVVTLYNEVLILRPANLLLGSRQASVSPEMKSYYTLYTETDLAFFFFFFHFFFFFATKHESDYCYKAQ